ncbi:MAG: hypothetical protein JXA66_07165 [Oligoflexia bacterium]|nr:hypothetical protein [Oligoflexia bacterium]
MTDDVITKAFCHNSHDLLDNENTISGYPSIKLLFCNGRISEYVYFSAVRSDNTRIGGDMFDGPEGISIKCPVCREELDSIAPCFCSEKGVQVAVYLDGKRSFNDSIGVCTNPECHNSLKKSAWQILAVSADNAEHRL